MPAEVKHRHLAFYGGSFDPLHLGHLKIAQSLTELFSFDEFTFVPAFRAPHKVRLQPTSPLHRFAMLCLATAEFPRFRVSTMELDVPARPYTFETLTKLVQELPDDSLYFVMGADSWADITTWREWESVLSLTNIVVVTRPGFEIGFEHVTPVVRERIVDVRGADRIEPLSDGSRIFVTDAVEMDVSATRIREQIRGKDPGWRQDVPEEVAKYIEKYQIYS